MTFVTQSRMASLIASFSGGCQHRHHDFRPQRLHADDVERLAGHVVHAHVDMILLSRAGRIAVAVATPVLTGAGLGNDGGACPCTRQATPDRGALLICVRPYYWRFSQLEENARPPEAAESAAS